jgi:hypothetical protein
VNETLRLLVAALTVYRLARLVSTEDCPLFACARLRGFADQRRAMEQGAGVERGPWAALDEGLRCPFCTGVWFAALCALLIWRPTLAGDFFLTWWGLAGAQSLLQELTHV